MSPKGDRGGSSTGQPRRQMVLAPTLAVPPAVIPPCQPCHAGLASPSDVFPAPERGSIGNPGMCDGSRRNPPEMTGLRASPLAPLSPLEGEMSPKGDRGGSGTGQSRRQMVLALPFSSPRRKPAVPSSRPSAFFIG
jgi:hypothetical protein